MKYFSLIIFATLIAACNADPGIIDDDAQQLPDSTNHTTTLVCDTLLPAPNAIYSNVIGEALVFKDSLGTEFDTLICVKNEAFEEKSKNNWGEAYCQTFYLTGYETNWLPTPQKYSVVFRIIQSWAVVDYFGESVGIEDYYARTPSVDNSVGIYEEIVINNHKFSNVTVYSCMANNSPCAFVNSFVFSQNLGLVAMKRKDKWWVVL